MSIALAKYLSDNLIQFGVFFAAASYAITQWRSGGSTASSEVITTYKEQVQQLKEELATQSKNHTDQMNALTAKVGELTGLITAKDTQITDLKNLLLEKTPEMLEFYQMGNKYFKEAAPILSEIKVHLTTHKE